MAKSTRVQRASKMMKKRAQPKPSLRVPAEALSARIWAVLQPVLDQGGSPPTLAHAQAIMNIAVSAWNAHFMALPPWNQPQFMATLRSSIDAMMGNGHGNALLADMLRIISTRYADDCRIVGKFAVTQRDDQYVLTCEAAVHESLLAAT